MQNPRKLDFAYGDPLYLRMDFATFTVYSAVLLNLRCSVCWRALESEKRVWLSNW